MRLITVLVALVAMCLGVYKLYEHIDSVAYARGVSETQTEVSKVGIDAQKINDQIQRKQTETLQEAIKNEQARAKQISVDRDSLRIERDRLREQADSYASGGDLPGTSPDACHQRIATITELFNQCAARYEEVAQHADGHASDSLTLQEAWAR